MSGSSLQVRPVVGRRDLAAFIDLPKRLYRGQPGYIAPLDLERRESLTAKNPYFAHAKVQYWLAERRGRVVGRISAQIDQAYLDHYQDHTGHFGCLDAEDDAEAYAALLATAEGWLRNHDMRRVTGPFSLSINEEAGLMIDGFDSRSILLVPWNPPYAQRHVEAQGYAKAKDLLCYDYDVQNSPETTGRKLIERAKVAERVRVRTADMRKFDREVAIRSE